MPAGLRSKHHPGGGGSSSKSSSVESSPPDSYSSKLAKQQDGAAELSVRRSSQEKSPMYLSNYSSGNTHSNNWKSLIPGREDSKSNKSWSGGKTRLTSDIRPSSAYVSRLLGGGGDSSRGSNGLVTLGSRYSNSGKSR